MTREIEVPVGAHVRVRGFLEIPDDAKGLVLFVHGSGSSRFSSRNQFVARHLFDAGFATLLVDLLTSHEEAIDDVTRQFRFDIDMLAGRVVEAIDWLQRSPATQPLAIGLFGASTGAAAALIAAKLRSEIVRAVVSRGGRPDLAMSSLPQVLAATLFIVGSRDSEVISLNREAYAHLRAEKEFVTILGATHLFEEPGALERVADHAMAWFERFLPKATQKLRIKPQLRPR